MTSLDGSYFIDLLAAEDSAVAKARDFDSSGEPG